MKALGIKNPGKGKKWGLLGSSKHYFSKELSIRGSTPLCYDKNSYLALDKRILWPEVQV
jgi:hypothetical protein